MGGVDFGGFEGAVGGAVGEGVGEGLPVGGEFLAGGVAELVEEIDLLQQGLFGFFQGGEDLGVGEVLGAFEGDVARDGGEAGEVFEFGGAGLQLAEGAGEEFGDVDGVAGVDVAGAGGVQLGDPAEVAVAVAEFAGEEEAGGVFDGFGFDGDGGADEVFDDAEEVIQAGGLGFAGVPAGRGDGAAEEDGEAFFFAGVVFREGEEDAAGFEEAELGGALADVQRGGGDEAWDDAGAKVGVVFAERVLHRDGCGVEAFGGDGAEGVAELGGGDEAEGLGLVEAAIGEGAAEGHEVVVGAVGGVGGGEGGAEVCGDTIEADDAGEFLDEVNGALEVEAVAGDLPEGGGRGGGLFDEAEFFEDGVAFVGGEGGDTEELGGAGFVEFDGVDEGRGGACDDSVVFGFASGDGEDEAGGGVGCAKGLLGIDSALEAVGGVGVDAEAAGGAADAGGLEVGDLEEDVGGGVGDSGFGAAHDAGDGEGFGLIGDNEVVGQEGAVLAVEGDEGFGFRGVADDNAAGEFGEVEGVEGLAHLHEDVIGDINDVVDGAEADAVESVLEPLGAGGDLHAADGAGDIEGAGFGGVEADFGGCGRAGFEVGLAEVGFAFEGESGEGGEFAGEAEVGEEVGAVGGDFEVEEDIGLDELAEGFADGGGGVEDEQAAVFIGEAELTAAAHHAEGGNAAEFAFFDLEAAGEFGAGEGDGDFIADFEVLGAADDLAVGALADVDLADGEFFGVGVLDGVFDLADDDEVGVNAFLLDAFDFDAGEGEEVGELRGCVVAEVEMRLKPGEGNLH